MQYSWLYAVFMTLCSILDYIQYPWLYAVFITLCRIHDSMQYSWLLCSIHDYMQYSIMTLWNTLGKQIKILRKNSDFFSLCYPIKGQDTHERRTLLERRHIFFLTNRQGPPNHPWLFQMAIFIELQVKVNFRGYTKNPPEIIKKWI